CPSATSALGRSATGPRRVRPSYARLPTHAIGKGVGRSVARCVGCAWRRTARASRLASTPGWTRAITQRTEVTMSAPSASARLSPPPTDLGTCNGLGFLLGEQRRLRRAGLRQQPDRALSPFVALRRRARTAAALR